MVVADTSRFGSPVGRQRHLLISCDELPRPGEAGEFGPAESRRAIHQHGGSRVRVFRATTRRVGLLQILVGREVHGDQVAVVAVKSQHRPNGEKADEEFQAGGRRLFHRRPDAQLA